jgi:hypothetical protein
MQRNTVWEKENAKGMTHPFLAKPLQFATPGE